MRRTKVLFIVGTGCAGAVIVLVIAVVLTAQLLANREMVKGFIVSKTDQVTGGKLDYDQLDLSIFPLPHLVARNIHLSRPETFALRARELSVYPRILPILMGRFAVRRLSLAAPEIRLLTPLVPGAMQKSPSSPETRSLEASINEVLAGAFGFMAAIDPGSLLEIEEGAVTLAYTDSTDIRIDAINARVENEGGELVLHLSCTSNVADTVSLDATADVGSGQAGGKLSMTGVNPRPLLLHASLPDAIAIKDSRIKAEIDFGVTGKERIDARFNLEAPTLTILRKRRALEIEAAALSGTMHYGKEGISLVFDHLAARQPALNLSAAASLQTSDSTGKPSLRLSLATKRLDIAAAADAARAIAGDSDEIRVAFDVAREGRLTDTTYSVAFVKKDAGWQLTRMKAAGHLSGARVALPWIDSTIEHLDGDVLYEDTRVEFKNLDGYFEGATFHDLDAAIDWKEQATLSIASPSVSVDAAPFYAWLTDFKALSKLKNDIAAVTGNLKLSALNIAGPLAEPQHWSFSTSGTPVDISLTSPRIPGAVKLSGGRITYGPRQQRVQGVTIDVLDGSFRLAAESRGNINAETSTWTIEGSMGQATIDWLTTILPIPDYLKIKPPVDLSGISIAWTPPGTIALKGGLKTAGGVNLSVDFTRTPAMWQIRGLDFSDGRSTARMSLRKQAADVEVAFAGNVEKQTADRLLSDNRLLSGRLEGDFRARIDTAMPLRSTFSGRIDGSGLHIQGLTRAPLDLQSFSIQGFGDRLKVAQTRIAVGDGRLEVDGSLNPQADDLVFDLNVRSDRIDESLLRALQAPVKKHDSGMPERTPLTIKPRGNIHLEASALTYKGYTWAPLAADIRVNGSSAHIQVNKATLCGISTIGEADVSSEGLVSFRITPTATQASLQETVACLGHKSVAADARYDLGGQIDLPSTHQDIVQSISGRLTASSNNGRIHYANILMKIFSILNITEVFTGGKTDLTESGFGYSKASVQATIGNGKLQFDEILLDGNALKLTGQGAIDLKKETVDIDLLAAPLKTVDRIVNKIPIVNYITGGSLISVPLRVQGKLSDPSVVPMSPSAVGKGLLNIMERTLKAPFKVVERAAKFSAEELGRPAPPTGESTEESH